MTIPRDEPAPGARRPALLQRCFVVALAALLAVSGVASAAAETIFASGFETGSPCPWTSTAPTLHCWANPAGGDWIFGANWRDGQVPPAGSDVAIDLPGLAGPVTNNTADLSLANLTVSNNLTINNHVVTVANRLAVGNGAVLLVQGAGAGLQANGTTNAVNATLSAKTGGSLSLPGWTSGVDTTVTIASGALSAAALVGLTSGRIAVNGATSAVSLPALADIDDTALQADGGAHLVLPGVTSYTFAEKYSGGSSCVQTSVQVCVNGTGSLLSLPNLQTVTGANSQNGLEIFASDTGNHGGEIDMPSLTTVATANNGLVLIQSNGANTVVDVSALPSLPAAGSLWISNGGHMKANALTTLTGGVVMGGSGNTFDAPGITGIGSELDVAGATLSFPLVTTLNGVELTVSAGGALTLGGVTSATSCDFSVPGGTLAMPALTTAPGSSMAVSGGGSLTAAALTSLTGGDISIDTPSSALNLGALANVDNTTFAVESGAVLTLPSVASYTMSQLPQNNTSMQIAAASTGSHLSFPNLTTVTADGHQLTFEIWAGNARISLAKLTTIHVPNNGSVRLDTFSDGAIIDLDALQTLPHGAQISISNGGRVNAAKLATVADRISIAEGTSSLNAPIIGNVNGGSISTALSASFALPALVSATDAGFSTGGGSLSLAALASATGTSLSVSDGGSLSAPVLTSLTGGSITLGGATSVLTAPMLGTIDDTTLKANSGGVLSLPNVHGYAFNGADISGDEIQALDTGSRVTLANLTTLTSDGHDLTVAASVGSGGGRVDLPQLGTILTPNGGTVSFLSVGAGTLLDLSGLVKLPAADEIVVDNGGHVEAGQLTSIDGDIVMTGSGNTFNAGSVVSITGALSISGVTLSYPLVTQLSDVYVAVSTGGSLTLAGVASVMGSTLVASGGALALPGLTTAHDTTMAVSSSGSLGASALTSFTSGELTISGSSSALTVTAVADIDDTTLSAASGGHLDLPGVGSYTFTEYRCDFPSCSEVFSQGTGSLVSLPDLLTISSNGQNLDFLAENPGNGGGHIDAPALVTADTSPGGAISFTASGSGTSIDLGALTTYDPQYVKFFTPGGGQIVLP